MRKLKKALSLTLALSLCMGLAIPALAEDEEAPMPFEEGVAPIEIDIPEGEYASIEQEDVIYEHKWIPDLVTKEQIDGFCAIKTGTKITVSHTGDDPTSIIYIALEKFTKSDESEIVYVYDDAIEEWVDEDIKDKYYGSDYHWNYLSNSTGTPDEYYGVESVADGTGHYWNDGHFEIIVDNDHNVSCDQTVDAIFLHPGDSVTFMLPDDGSDTIYHLYAEICYPQYPYYYWTWINIKIDDELASSAPAEPEQPTEPSEPGTPVTPGTPVPGAVVLSPQNLEVDGENVVCEKYNIDGSNYFKLRDLAYALKGTGSRFGVGFDEASSTVSITTGEAYEPTGTEMEVGVDNSATTQPSSQTIMIDGKVHGELTVYNIGGSNFFQLRELGTLLGFEVGYDIDTNTATVRSTQN